MSSPISTTAHFLTGFAHKDGKYRFRPDWTGTPAANKPPRRMGPQGPVDRLPEFPDHVELIESADADHPFRLATSPSRSFLNSTFAETQSSKSKEKRPELLIHPRRCRGPRDCERRQGEARQSPWRGGHARKARRRTAPWRGHP
jgi:anaerobic selenocysteine-containing dehydrogenase